MKKEKWAVILLLCAVALCGLFGCDKNTQTPNGTIEAGVDYSEALEVISTFGVTQDELDAACEALRAQLS